MTVLTLILFRKMKIKDRRGGRRGDRRGRRRGGRKGGRSLGRRGLESRMVCGRGVS